MADTNQGNVKVVARFRPLNDKEKQNAELQQCINFIDDRRVSMKRNQGDDSNNMIQNEFKFDKVFRLDATQQEVYENTAKPIIKSVLQGFNCTVFTYGQTSSGKTFTMLGSENQNYDLRGIIPRSLETIFETIDESGPYIEYQMTVSMVEIYMEKIRDLLDITKNKLQIRESKAKGIYIENVTEQIVIEEAEIFHILRIGEGNRSKFATKMNEFSSRSHTIFMLQINQKEKLTHSCKVGKLFLIDLAGSEKVQKTQAEGKTLEEAKQINKSLSALGNVINALTDQKLGTHIPYRDSKLTRMLQESLGGNAKTVLIITCSPSLYNEAETYSTLRFGFRALSIKNTPVINRQFTIEELQIRQLKLEKLVKLKVLMIKKLEEMILKNNLKLPDYNLNGNLKELEIDENNYAVTPVTSPKNQELEVINQMSNRSNILVKTNSVDLDSNKDDEEDEEEEEVTPLEIPQQKQFQQQQNEEILEPKLSKKKSGFFFRSARNPLDQKPANEISLFGKNNAEENKQDNNHDDQTTDTNNSSVQHSNMNLYKKKDQVISNLKIFDNLVVKKHDHNDKEWQQKNQHLIEEIFKFNYEENKENNPTLDSVEANFDQIEQNQQQIKQQFMELDEQQKMLTIGTKGMTQTFYTMRKLENQLEQQQKHISEQSKRIDIFRREFNWVSEKAHNLEQDKIQLNQQIQLKDQMQTLLKNQQDDEKKYRDQLLDEVTCLKQQIGWLKKSKANLFHLIFKKIIDRTQAQQPQFQRKDSQHEQDKLEFIESSGQQIFNLMMADLQKDTIIQKILELCSKDNKNLLVKFQDIITKVLELNDDKVILDVETIEEKFIEEEQQKDEIQQEVSDQTEKILNNIQEANTPLKIKQIQCQQVFEKNEGNQQQQDVLITTEFLSDNSVGEEVCNNSIQKKQSSPNNNQIKSSPPNNHNKSSVTSELDSSLNNITNSIKKFQRLSIQTFKKYKNQYCKDIQSPDTIFKKIYETGIKQVAATLNEFQFPIFIKNPYQIQKVQKPYRIYNVRKVIKKDLTQEGELYQPKDRFKFTFSISGKPHQINLTIVDVNYIVKEKLKKTVRLAKLQYARIAWPPRMLDSHKSFLFSQFQLEQQVIFSDLMQNLVFYEQMLRQLNLIYNSHLYEISNKCTQIETLSIRSIQHKIFSNMKQQETQMVFPCLVEFMREFKTQLRKILNTEFHAIKQIAIDKRVQYNKIKLLQKEQKRREMLKNQQQQQQQQQQMQQQLEQIEEENVNHNHHQHQNQQQNQQQQINSGLNVKRNIKMSIETKNLENLTTQPDSHYDNQSSSADSFELDHRLMVDKNSAEHLHFSPKSPPLQSAIIFQKQEQLINQLKLTIEYMKLEMQELKEQQVEQQLRSSYQQDYSKMMDNLDTFSTFDLIHHSPPQKKGASKKSKADGETNGTNNTSVFNKKVSPKAKKSVVKKHLSSSKSIHLALAQEGKSLPAHTSTFQQQQQQIILQQQSSLQSNGSNKKSGKKNKVKRYTVEKDDKNCVIY